MRRSGCPARSAARRVRPTRRTRAGRPGERGRSPPSRCRPGEGGRCQAEPGPQEALLVLDDAADDVAGQALTLVDRGDHAVPVAGETAAAGEPQYAAAVLVDGPDRRDVRDLERFEGAVRSKPPQAPRREPHPDVASRARMHRVDGRVDGQRNRVQPIAVPSVQTGDEVVEPEVTSLDGADASDQPSTSVGRPRDALEASGLRGGRGRGASRARARPGGPGAARPPAPSPAARRRRQRRRNAADRGSCRPRPIPRLPRPRPGRCRGSHTSAPGWATGDAGRSATRPRCSTPRPRRWPEWTRPSAHDRRRSRRRVPEGRMDVPQPVAQRAGPGPAGAGAQRPERRGVGREVAPHLGPDGRATGATRPVGNYPTVLREPEGITQDGGPDAVVSSPNVVTRPLPMVPSR